MFGKDTWKKLGGGVLLCCVIFFVLFTPFRACRSGSGGVDVETRSDTIPGDSEPTVSPTYAPQSAMVVYRTVMQPVDTAAILAECMALRYYSDTLRNDSELLAVVQDTVSMAGIVARRFVIQNKRPVAVVTSVYKTAKGATPVQVYAGVFGGYQVKTARPVFGPEISLTIGEAATIGYGYDILNNGHMGHVSAKLTWRKHK